MNILLISQMYPAYPGQSLKQVNDALHRIVRRWTATEKVLVVRAHLAPDFRREDPGIKQGFFSLDGVDILNHYFFKVPRCRIFYFNRLYAKLNKIRFYPDVIAAHIGYSLYLGYKIARHFEIPLISAVHHGDLLRGRRMLSDKIWQNIFNHSHGIACRSHNVYREFVRQHTQLQERCFTAYSGIEKELIETKDFAIDKLGEWKKSKPGQVRIISVCSLVKLKNIDINLRTLARLDKKIDWFYTIIGEGEERNSLENMANRLGIANRVLFTGYKPREEAIQEMKRSHIFTMVSAPETFGMAYLEAMAAGNIVIGARGYGIDGVVEQGRNGFLCTPRDEEDIRLTLENIITGLNKKELAIILESSHKTVLQYTEDKASRSYLDNIYKFTGKELNRQIRKKPLEFTEHFSAEAVRSLNRDR